MSDGAAAGGSPAPTSNGTNGAHSAQTPVAPAPTAKNGDGAVVQKPEVAKFQPIKRKLKFGDGQEEEYEVSSEEELDRMRLGQKLSDKAQKELLRERREREAEAKRLKDIGFDPTNPDEWFAKRLQEELRKEQLKPEERAKEEHERRI